MNKTEQYRYFLKDTIRKSIDFRTTDQHKGIPVPPVEKPYDSDADRIPTGEAGVDLHLKGCLWTNLPFCYGRRRESDSQPAGTSPIERSRRPVHGIALRPTCL